jgi:hypothetical protein
MRCCCSSQRSLPSPPPCPFSSHLILVAVDSFEDSAKKRSFKHSAAFAAPVYTPLRRFNVTLNRQKRKEKRHDTGLQITTATIVHTPLNTAFFVCLIAVGIQRERACARTGREGGTRASFTCVFPFPEHCDESTWVTEKTSIRSRARTRGERTLVKAQLRKYRLSSMRTTTASCHARRQAAESEHQQSHPLAPPGSCGTGTCEPACHARTFAAAPHVGSCDPSVVPW